MSTTGGTEQGTLTLLEDPKRLQKKVMSAVTDSDGEIRHDPEGKPGVSGLLSLQSAVEGVSIAELEARYQGAGYGDFKREVAERVIDLLAPLQARHAELAADPAEVERLLQRGAVRERIGFLAGA
jgi:tryptophanyl-tRNA synthetase